MDERFKVGFYFVALTLFLFYVSTSILDWLDYGRYWLLALIGSFLITHWVLNKKSKSVGIDQKNMMFQAAIIGIALLAILMILSVLLFMQNDFSTA